jgi:hypothetical protein
MIYTTLAATLHIRAARTVFQTLIRNPVIELILVALVGLILWIARRLS